MTPSEQSSSSAAARAKRPRRWGRLIGILFALGVVLLIAGTLVYQKKKGIEGWTQRTEPIATQGVTEQKLAADLAGAGPDLPASAYQSLFRYLMEGFNNYRSPQGARVFYPGAPSENGRLSDGMEGFARLMPLAAAWLSAGQPDEVDVGGRKIVLSQQLKQGLLAGTKPDGPEYWGTMKDYAQIGYESGDIAVALWLSRKQIWSTLTPAEQTQVATWLKQVLDIRMYPGNWSLVPMVVHRTLKTLGVDVAAYDERAETTFERFQTLYRGDGWFNDPPNGFDYYNSWAVHYHLFWLSQMDPAYHREFISQAQTAFGSNFKYLFGPNGHPMYGRSVCYRMAASTGLLTAAATASAAPAPAPAAAPAASTDATGAKAAESAPTATAAKPGATAEPVSMGQAMRALDDSVKFFVSHQALSAGTVTQGFCGTDLSVIDRYSGSGSCLQGLRALTVAFYLQGDKHVFDLPRQPLPVEVADFSTKIAATGWTVTGKRDTGTVELSIDENPADAKVSFKPYSWTQRLLETATHRPNRPDNHPALYFSKTYSTASAGIACKRMDER